MLKMKNLLILCVFVLLIAGLLQLFHPFSESPRSKILVKDMSVTPTADGGSIIQLPIASLPEKKESEIWEPLEGKVISAPNNPSDKNSNAMMAVERGKEIVVVTNLPYVRTLEYFYIGKNVRLRGKWRKDAVIYGRSYKSFWVEDIELKDQGMNGRK